MSNVNQNCAQSTCGRNRNILNKTWKTMETNKLQKLEDALIKHMLTAADMGDRGDMGDMSDRGDMGDRSDIRAKV